MKRKLLRQIATEWRSNLWLVIELLVISVILFFVADVLVSHSRLRSYSVGMDVSDVYRLGFGVRPSSSPQYVEPEPKEGEEPSDARWRFNQESFERIASRLRECPEIEAVAYGSSAPYNYNFWGTEYVISGIPNDSTQILTNRFLVDPDYFKVFHINGVNGETPEQLGRLIAEDKVVIASYAAEDKRLNITVNDLYNKQLINRWDTEEKPMTIGAVVGKTRRSDYEPCYFSALFSKADGNGNRQLYMRVKEGTPREFIESLMQPTSVATSGNVYLINAESFKDIRNDLHRNDEAQLRNLIICMGFLLLTVFLGLLGTFWFRTQQRVREIAIRKVTGARPSQVFRRLMGEGLLLLAVATPLAWIIDWYLADESLVYSVGMELSDRWLWLGGEALGVAVLMALMIVAGIYYPARRAMKIDPAETLRGE